MDRTLCFRDLPHRVEMRSADGDILYEVMAACAFEEMAEAALQEAIEQRPNATWLAIPGANTPPPADSTLRLLHSHIEIYSADDRHQVALVGASMNTMVARAAYFVAAEMFPDFLVVLRHGAWAIEESKDWRRYRHE